MDKQIPKILIATGNPHKVDEVRAICAQVGANITLLCLADIVGGKAIPEPFEGETTFEGNATLKAHYYANQTGLDVWADDSGLAVEALDGAPGVLSARYSGLTGSRAIVDPANNRKLMEAMRSVPKEKRAAKFVCALAWCKPHQVKPVAVVRGEFAGRLLMIEECGDPSAPEKGRGTHGFGYDPLLWLDDVNCTSAQLAPEIKNARSHRGAAVRAMLKLLPIKRGADTLVRG